MNKIIIYQVFTRLFGNKNTTRKPNGTIEENGCGKMSDFTTDALQAIKQLGATHIWYTGLIEHATQTAYTDIEADAASIVKGKAGSPYAIRDYYDIDPDLALKTARRMQEFDALIQRTHATGLKAIIDFVPNHVARQYRSDAKPNNVRDLGADDRTDTNFDPQNNFYYCPNLPFAPCFDVQGYTEFPAKATGNDCFSNSPSINDWYETVKLNYGVDYSANGQTHFDPIPDTWLKMRDILIFWAKKKIDGFRCDMAEMVPVEFWQWAIAQVKAKFPDLIFIAEIYNPTRYRDYIFKGGFDFIYNKVGLYDTLRNIICNFAPAHCITPVWQATDDIREQMLNFLENHDEQRIASDFFAADAQKGIPAMIVATLLSGSPVMIYFGQELGEKGMDAEGFSGCDGRTTIFDYWSIDKLIRWQNGNFTDHLLNKDEKQLSRFYRNLFYIARNEKAATNGSMYDLTWLNFNNPHYNTARQFAWIRRYRDEYLLIVVNFDDKQADIKLNITQEVHNFFRWNAEKQISATELLTNKKIYLPICPEIPIDLKIKAHNGVIIKFNHSSYIP